MLGLGHSQPERIITNDELSTTVDTNDDWIRSRTGIRERHIKGTGEDVLSIRDICVGHRHARSLCRHW